MATSTDSSKAAATLLINKESVSAALQNDKGKDALLKSFEIIDFLAPGEGYLGSLTSVKVLYSLEDEEEKSTSYVVKLNGGGDENHDASQKVFFAKEATILYQFLPLMNKILEEHNQRPLCIPICYYASLDPGKEILFMQDMRVRKFTKIKDELGIDVNHTKVIIQELARLHAAFVLLEK